MPLSTLLFVGLGSFIGGILRYSVSLAMPVQSPGYIPWPTLVVNIIGSFLIGYAYQYARIVAWPIEWRLFFITGFLGGFTTFSAFSIETLGLLERGHWTWAGAYAAGSVILGLLAAWAGTQFGTSH